MIPGSEGFSRVIAKDLVLDSRGRVQIFNNWSPFMVADPSKVWIGLEYFCFEGDGLWNSSDADLIEQAKRELAKIGLAKPEDIVDGTPLEIAS